MNMISTAFPIETDASNKPETLAKKFVSVWEKKNSKTARAGGVSLMALSLAACGAEDETPFAQSDIDAATAPIAASLVVAQTQAATALVAQAAAEQTAATSVVALAEAQTAAATALVAKAASDTTAATATVAAATATAASATATAAKEAAEAALVEAQAATATAVAATATAVAEKATAEASLATAQASLTAATSAKDTAEASLATQTALITGAGFADASAFVAAYTDLTDGSALVYTTSLTADALIGSIGDDTITAASGTYANTDSMTDVSTTDSDTATITHTAGMTPVINNVETVNLNLNATGAANVVGSSLSGVDTLTITRGDVTVGGATLAGNKTVVITAVDAADVGTIVAGVGTTTVAVTQAVTTGMTINADAASGNVTVAGTATVDAAGAGLGDTVQVTASAAAAVTTEATANAGAVTIRTAAATVSLLNGGGGELLDGVLDITANGATTVGIANATGGLTLSATADNAQVTVGNIDASGANITVGTGVLVNPLIASNSDIDVLLDGTGTATDVVTVAGAGNIDLDVNTGQLIATANLSGTTAAVDYNMITSVPTTVNLTGSQSVTFSQTADGLNALDLNNNLTAGTATVAITAVAGGAVVATNVDADNIILEVEAGLDAGSLITVASGATFTVAADQTGFDVAGSAASSTINVITADDTQANGTTILLELDDVILSTNITTVNIDATVGAFDADSVTLAAAGNLSITGTKNFDLGILNASSLNSTTSGTVTLDTAAGATTLNSITTGDGADNLTLDVATVVMNMDSGAGNDVIAATNQAGSQYVMGLGNDAITLNNANAVVVVGGDGADTLNTAQDADVIFSGGTGSDTFNLTADANLSDNVNFALASVEVVTLATTVDMTLSAAQLAANATFAISGLAGGTETLTVVGSANADVLTGAGVTATNIASITLNGLGGNDTITGTAVADTISGGIGSDGISGGTGTDTVTYAGAANTTETGTQVGIAVNLGSTAQTAVTINSATSTNTFLADSVTSLAANSGSYVYGGAGATNFVAIDTFNSIENVVGTNGTDYIVGSATANTITGGAGLDYMNGGLGNDTFIVASTATTGVGESIIGGGGTGDTIRVTGDTVFSTTDAQIATVENITLIGANVDVTLTGQSEGFTITGEANNNIIISGGGADTITGGAGVDIMTGAAGADNYVFAAGDYAVTATTDQIIGFATLSDTIKLGVSGAAAGEFTAVAGTTGDAFAAVLIDANAVFNTTNAQSYYMTAFGTDSASVQGALFLNMDNNATADGVILIGSANSVTSVALGTALVVAADIIV